MGKVTKVDNGTDSSIELKQGSANVFHLLHVLPKGKSYDIKVDESATYREYWCAVQPKSSPGVQERVVFSSDHCTEYSKVRIYKDKTGKYTWTGTEKRGTWRNTPVTPDEGEKPGKGETPVEGEEPVKGETPVEGGGSSSKWWHFWGIFGKKVRRL